MDEKRISDTGGSTKETSQSPQAGDTPTGQMPQGPGDLAPEGGSTYPPGQGGTGGGGYQPGQSERAGGTTSRPSEDSGRGTDASES
jgi:hypothetical protein